MKKPLTALQESLKKRLSGGRFRQLNEDLYTQPGHASFSYIKENPSAYAAYHEGYRRQVESWPLNPLDAIIDECKAETSKKLKVLKGGIKMDVPVLVVADFGCGEARLSATLYKLYSSSVSVFSFDLAKPVGENASLVTPCDMANVPLASVTVDVAVFCLSLMGTNFWDFIKEADRVLKTGGRLLISEVKSRFQDVGKSNSNQSRSTNGKTLGKRKREEYDESSEKNRDEDERKSTSALEEFIYNIEQLGYSVDKVDDSNSHFILAYFRKTRMQSMSQSKDRKEKDKQQAIQVLTMKPCVYKKR